MITTNVIQRVFSLLFQDTQGTCFTIEIDGKQYLITAKHLIENIQEKDTIKIFHQNQWKTINTFLAGHCNKNIDISVLSTDIQLSPTYKMDPTAAHLQYGQDVYFLGFPYFDGKELSKMNRGFPFPFVKKAIISNMGDIGIDKSSIFYLDGHNNEGFSGGPVVFKKIGGRDYQVGAVISGYRFKTDPILYKEKEETGLEYKSNTGVIISYAIKCATDIIKTNPIGLQVNCA